MAGGSKKGNPFELEVCRLLSRWWSGGARDDVFYRTGGSGGRATRRGRAGRGTANQCGDVGASDPDGRPLTLLLALEIKRGYSRDTLHDLLDRPGGRASAYELWMAQARESARHAGAPGWLIIHRRDKRDAAALLSAAAAALLLGAGADLTGPPHMVLNVGCAQAVLYRLSDLLGCVEPDHVRSAARRT